jgi:AbiU2
VTDQPEMSVPLSSVYGALLGEADALAEKIETFGLLFGMGDARVDLLVRTAGNVTWVLYEALWDSILLGMNRLLDRAETMGQPNLALERLIAMIRDEKEAHLADELEGRLEEIRGQACTVKMARDKQIAHRDRDTRPVRLRGVSEGEVRTLGTRLAQFFRSISEYYDSCEALFAPIQSHGTESLVHYLDLGVKAEATGTIVSGWRTK